MEKRITVVQFIGAIQDGGAETLVKDYALMLDKSKFNVVVIAGYELTDSANSKVLRENNVKVYTLFRRSNLFTKLILHTVDEPIVCKRLKRILDSVKPDVIHAHLSVLRYLKAVVDYYPQMRIVYTCHNLPKLFFDNPKRPKERDAIMWLKSHRTLQIIALHDQMAEEIKDMLETDLVTTIHNGIDLSRFQKVSKTKNELRRFYNIPSDAFVIGHIGRFNVQKNHAFLLEIFRKVKERKINAFLLLIGDGELEPQIRKYLKDEQLERSCMILSHRKDIPELLKCMDVFVFPSIFEGLGIVLIEAQAVGLRCVVSDAVPLEAYVTNKVVSVGLNDDVERWADVVMENTFNTDINNRLNDYDMHQEIRKLEKIYEG